MGRSKLKSAAGDASDQERLVDALVQRDSAGRLEGRVRVIETHISYVVLTGTYAYKVKKAVDFGFLDFTTLSARRHFCEQEVRLNRRLAPAVYIDVVPITGSVESPDIGGEGPALEYAVRMREFPQEALATDLLARNELSSADIDALAEQVAAFHTTIATPSSDSAFGAPEVVLNAALRNCSRMRPLVTTPTERNEIDELAAWTEHEYRAREARLRARHQRGFIRECHGDLHLGNIAKVDGKLTIFDCIEFNDSMRWIDVMNEVAFTVMDLEERKRPDLARRFLNAYLQITGDYAGLAVFRFYRTYRALVRAKIHRLRAVQLEGNASESEALAEYREYLDLARSYTWAPHGAIVLTHGPSGCGKTTRSQTLLELTEAVRIRSDVERKRLHGVTPFAQRASGVDGGLYTPAATDATYRRLCTLARELIAAGFVAIIDATFLQRWQRDLFRTLASDLRVPLVIVAFEAREATLRQRVARRMAEGNDASDADLAVLEHQLRTQQPFAADELADVVAFDAEQPLARAAARASWRDVLDRIAPAAADSSRFRNSGPLR